MWTDQNRARYDRRGLRYPSDLTDEEWALVEPEIPPAKRGGNKRTVDVRGGRWFDVCAEHWLPVACDPARSAAAEHDQPLFLSLAG
jgi:transposase